MWLKKINARDCRLSATSENFEQRVGRRYILLSGFHMHLSESLFKHPRPALVGSFTRLLILASDIISRGSGKNPLQFNPLKWLIGDA